MLCNTEYSTNNPMEGRHAELAGLVPLETRAFDFGGGRRCRAAADRNDCDPGGATGRIALGLADRTLGRPQHHATAFALLGARRHGTRLSTLSGAGPGKR